jgi:hypothetical protein
MCVRVPDELQKSLLRDITPYSDEKKLLERYGFVPYTEA